MANILITGGTGLIGRAISEKLLEKGHEVRWLSRSNRQEGDIKTFTWNLEKMFIDEKAFENLHVIIHLAGAGIADKRWTKSYKEQLLSSRMKSSELLYNYYLKSKPPLKTFIGASAVGYYGSASHHTPFTETNPAGNDFLAQVCEVWEKSYLPFQKSDIRTVIFRIGIVLSNKGGAYAKLKPLFQLGLGAALGSGQQGFPWIHLDDLSHILFRAITDTQLNGVYNAVADDLTTNQLFSKAFAKSLNRPFFLPAVPELLLKTILGERAETVTRGARINNSKLMALDIDFNFKTIEVALNDLSER